MTLEIDIGHAVEEWLHEFRATHGQPYAFALVSDEGAVHIRPAANTEAQLRSRGEAQRWRRGAWVEQPAGPAFSSISESLKLAAWQPDLARFRENVYASMLRAMIDAAKRGVFGERGRGGMTIFVTLDQSANARKLELRSALLLNPNGEADLFLAHLETDQR